VSRIQARGAFVAFVATVVAGHSHVELVYFVWLVLLPLLLVIRRFGMYIVCRLHGPPEDESIGECVGKF
jgi:hypothetical protein